MTELRTKVLCISVLRVASLPRVKLAGCQSALPTPSTHPVGPSVYSTDRFNKVLVLHFVALWFILRGDCFKSCLVILLFSPFSLVITSLGEERVNFSAFRTFVRFRLLMILSAVF